MKVLNELSRNLALSIYLTQIINLSYLYVIILNVVLNDLRMLTRYQLFGQIFHLSVKSNHHHFFMN